jgi:GNAT superfamily N-acetyltransferase
LAAFFTRVRRTPAFLLVQNALKRVPFTPVALGKLCFLELRGVPSVPPRLLRGAAVVRRATLDDVPRLARLRDMADTFRARFAQGDECMVALVDGRIVGYEWFTQGPVHEEGSWGYEIEIPPGYVYAYDAYIDPAYRNSGIWLRFKAHLADWMKETDTRGVLTFVDYGNWASLRTHLRFGFRPRHCIVALNVLGAKLFMTVAETIDLMQF